MAQLDRHHVKIKHFARRRRSLASRCRELSDHEVDRLIIIVGVDRVRRAFSRITSAPSAEAGR